MFAVWKNQWVTVPCQELSLCPPCTANPDWGTGDSASGEFHCLPRHFTVPHPDPHLQFETGSCRNLLGSGLLFVFLGSPKSYHCSWKKPHREPCLNPSVLAQILHPWRVLLNGISAPCALEPHLHSLLCLCGTYTKFREFSSKWLLVLKYRICFLNI